VAQEGQRRSIFLRYLGEVAGAVSQINGADRAKLYEQLLAVAKKRTAEADVKLDDRGRPIQEQEEELELGDNCIIVPQVVPGMAETPADDAAGKPKKRGRGAAAAGGEDEPMQPAAPPHERTGRRPGKAARTPAAKQAGAKKPAKRR
jgi:hypothetical protein